MRVSRLKVATVQFGYLCHGDTFMYNPAIVARKCKAGQTTVYIEVDTGAFLNGLASDEVVTLVDVTMSAKTRIVRDGA